MPIISAQDEFLPNPNLPSNEQILEYCIAHQFPRGAPLHNPETNEIITWIKSGSGIPVHEARTQHWTACMLHEVGSIDLEIRAPRVYRTFEVKYTTHSKVCIVMEYVDGVDCNSEDVDLVAKAVQTLIGLRRPENATLGHIGGGTRSIVHTFFPRWDCGVACRNDQDFYRHIRNLLKLLEIKLDRDISTYESYLCPTDINPGNFRKHTTADGRVVLFVLDFYATCFMPLPFIEVAMKKDEDEFSELVANKVSYESTAEGKALLTASYGIVVYGRASIVLPPGVQASDKVYQLNYS